MLFVILSGAVVSTASDTAQIEQIQHDEEEVKINA